MCLFLARIQCLTQHLDLYSAQEGMKLRDFIVDALKIYDSDFKIVFLGSSFWWACVH